MVVREITGTLRTLVFLTVFALMAKVVLSAGPAWAEEFYGPFPSWANVKTEFGAVGDGKSDDTAAIQKALESVRGIDSPKKVLYFPAGTYRITSTLRLDRISHNEPLGMSIAGEDPEKTIIKWDGPAGASMLLYDAWYASLSRLTFDGAGKAKTAIQHGPAFATANEATDLIIKDVEFGMEAGQRDGIAETAVLRCRFYRCSKAAISIQNFNSLDWYIWDCWFEDCGIGACNEFGAGNFHVYNSSFLRSVEADITIRHTGYFSFMGNRSLGSRRFFHAKRAGNWKDAETWGSQATLQDNLILDPADATPIVIENNGPNMVLDNIIRMKGAGPAIRSLPPTGTNDLIVIGNTWTVEKAIEASGRTTELDNKTVKPEAVMGVKLTPVPFAVRARHPVIEVAAGTNAAAIQAAIDQAAGMKGKRPVVHLPKGNYTMEKTLVIPAGADMVLVGDGGLNATQITGSGVDPVIRVQGPTHADFRDFMVNGGKDGVGMLVANCDQAGGRVFGEQLNAANCFEYGMVFEGLKKAGVELRDAGHNGMQVIGGGAGAQAWVALFAGASSRTRDSKAGIHLYDVQNEGRLLVRDIWYEGDSWSLMNLTGSGEFAYHCGFVAPRGTNDWDKAIEWERDLRQSGVAALQVDGFKGKLCFTLVSSVGSLRVKAPSADLKLYLLGYLTKNAKTEMDLGGNAVKGQVVAEHLKTFRGDGTGLDSLDSVGKATPAFVREMLTPLRTVKPQPVADLPDGVSDVRFHRVFLSGRNGVRVQAAK